MKIHESGSAFLTAPTYARKALSKRYIKGMFRNLLPLRPEALGDDHILTVFQTRYQSGNLSALMDGHISWYLKPLDHFLPALHGIPNTEDTVALDLGCGTGAVGYWLRDRAFRWHYFGIDLAAQAERYHARLHNNTCRIHDARMLDTLDLPARPAVFFAVNLFTYIEHPETVLRKAHDIAGRDALLVIIDPYPSPYWDRDKLYHMRRPAVWRRGLKLSGWRVDGEATLCVWKTGSRGWMPLSQTYLCRKQPD